MPRVKKLNPQRYSVDTLAQRKQLSASSSLQHQFYLSPRELSVARKRRHRPGTRALQEIRTFQKTTNLLIPRLPFARLVRELTEKHWPKDESFRYTIEALLCLQTACEAYIIGIFEDSLLCSLHAKRVTLQVRDVQLALRIRGRDF